jgi:hypothetical protein
MVHLVPRYVAGDDLIRALRTKLRSAAKDQYTRMVVDPESFFGARVVHADVAKRRKRLEVGGEFEAQRAVK